MTPFIGERVINHSKDVLEDTYDLWDYFDEKRDALERFETYLLQLRDSETTNVSGKEPSASDSPSWRRKEKRPRERGLPVAR